jgi:DNA polymerase-3 subunit delta
MPTYLFWGDDDFAIAQAVKELRQAVLDSDWQQFNYEKIPGDAPDAARQALNQALTPPFGLGGRLVWLEGSTACQHCPEDLFAQFQRTLPAIPPNSHLLLTSVKKPDGKLKLAKLLKQAADTREFALISPWKIEEIASRVREFSEKLGVKLTPTAVQLLAESVGNDTRQLWNELQKLGIYGQQQAKPLDAGTIAALVNANSQNSLQLAAAIRQGNTAQALGLVTDLLARNEPALRLVATLVGQFRTWAAVKLKLEAGERDEQAIAAAAEIANPKRIYFIRKEVQLFSSRQFLATLPILLELEFALKKGAEPTAILQTAIVQLCRLFT